MKCNAEQGLWNGRASVRLSVLSFDRAAAACGGFAAKRHEYRRYRPTTAAAGRPVAAAPQHGAAARRSAVTASSVALSADVGSWTQTCSAGKCTGSVCRFAEQEGETGVDRAWRRWQNVAHVLAERVSRQANVSNRTAQYALTAAIDWEFSTWTFKIQ